MASHTPPPGFRDPKLRKIVNTAFKDEVNVVLYSEETNHEYFELEITLGPKGGNPLHWHTKNDEIFTAGPNGVGLQLDDKIIHLKAGETARVPVRHNHRFFNPSDEEEVTFTVRGEPGSDGDSFAKGLYVLYGLSRDGFCDERGVPKHISHVAIFMYRTDTWFSGWKQYLKGPLFWLAYLYARYSGEEERLIEKYYTGYQGSERNW